MRYFIYDSQLDVLKEFQVGNSYALGRDTLDSMFNESERKDITSRVDSGQVSRRHCNLDLTKSTPYVEDCNSKNGTYVNEKRVARTKLKDKDLLKLGPWNIRFFMGEEEPQIRGFDDLNLPKTQPYEPGEKK